MLDDRRTGLHRFDTSVGSHLFVSDGSRIYDLSSEDALALGRLLDGAATADDAARSARLMDMLFPAGEPPRIDARPAAPPPLHSLSLNVAQACNMSCGYCYADAGAFGGRSRVMSFDTARASVDCLLAEAAAGRDVVVGFMGGEPLLNRPVLHAVTRYAAEAANARSHPIRFSITTNGTLLTAEDVELFAEFPFTVTMSVDGPPALHNRLRLMNDGGDAYQRLAAGLALFEAHGRPRQLSARITMTPRSGDPRQILEHVIGMGFDEAGFAPVLVSPVPELAFTEEELISFLAGMVRCGESALRHARAGQPYPFTNFVTAMQQLHRGTHRPYPCGAGAAYLSVNAEGKIYACHRLIDDEAFAMGDVRTGSDRDLRASHLRDRHVDRAEPCQSCWARYVCGGGCYHEVSRRGRIGCDYIRGWLHFCLGAYVELAEHHPGYFDGR